MFIEFVKRTILTNGIFLPFFIFSWIYRRMLLNQNKLVRKRAAKESRKKNVWKGGLWLLILTISIPKIKTPESVPKDENQLVLLLFDQGFSLIIAYRYNETSYRKSQLSHILNCSLCVSCWFSLYVKLYSHINFLL